MNYMGGRKREIERENIKKDRYVMRNERDEKK